MTVTSLAPKIFSRLAAAILPDKDARRLALRGIARHPFLFASAAMATACIVVANMIEPQLVRLIVDKAIAEKSLHLLAILTPLWLGLFLVSHAILYWRIQSVTRLAEGTARGLRFELFKTILDLPPSFHATHDAADLNLQVTKDLDDIGPLWASIPLAFLWYSLTVVGSIVLALLISVKLTLYLGGIVVLLSLAWKSVTRGATKNAVCARAEHAELGSTARRALSRIKLVQLYDAQPAFISHFEKANARLRDRRVRHGLWVWLSSTVGDAMEFTAMMGVLMIGGYMCVRGELTIGALFSYLLYINYLSQAFMNLANQLSPLAIANAAGHRIGTTMAYARQEAGATPAQALESPIESISVSNLSFGYSPGEPILRDVNATFSRGGVCLLWGPNASGKTTLLDIICGYRQPDSGAVCVNGKDLRSLCPQRFRERLAVIAQEDIVVEYTVEENLRLGRPSATNQELVAALRQVLLVDGGAECERMLQSPADQLSTGQKRRIAIARAFLRTSDVVLLDEPTANLDEESVKTVLDCLEKLARHSVVIMTTQDPRVAKISRRKYVLQNSRIVEPPGFEEAGA